MAKTKQYIPQEGDIVSCDNESGYVSAAVITENDGDGCPCFSVCLNFRGREDEVERIWDEDRFYFKKLRPATKAEMGNLLAKLVEEKHNFRCEHGKMYVTSKMAESWAEEDEATKEVVPEPQITTKSDRFANYIYETAKTVHDTGAFRFTSRIARKYHVSSANTELLFRTGLHELKDIEWLRSTEGRRFCDELYEYVLNHAEHLAVIPQSQRI